MSFGFRVELSGIDDFAEKMRALDDYVQSCVQDAIVYMGEVVKARAQEFAPIRTGRLMQSITVQLIYKWVVKVACIGVNYAMFQELGTRYISPKYFLTRAIAENANNFMFIVQAALQRAAEEAGAE